MDHQTEKRLGAAIRKSEALPLAQQPAPIFDAAGAAPLRIGRVIAASPIGSNRWAYTIQPMQWTGSTWANNGAVITGCKNLNEWFNTSGACGNGVNATLLQGNFAVRPASVGTPLVIYYGLGGGQYVFSLANGVDGTCTGF